MWEPDVKPRVINVYDVKQGDIIKEGLPGNWRYIGSQTYQSCKVVGHVGNGTIEQGVAWYTEMMRGVSNNG